MSLYNGLSDAELRQKYQDADLCVMPMRDATANNSVLEAMACGLPLLISDLPGARDYVNDQAARFVPVGNVNEFVKELLALQAMPETLETLGQSAREQALGFSFDKVAEQTVGLYNKLRSADSKEHVGA